MSLVPSNREKIREEIDKLKSLKGRKFWEYVWEYYKLVIIGLLAVLLLASFIIYDTVVNPTPTIVFNVAWTYSPQFMGFSEELADELTINMVEYSRNEVVHVFSFAETADVQLDMSNQVRFVAMIVAGELDVLITTRDEIQTSAADGMLMDISLWFPANTEGLLQAEGLEGILSVYGISIANSRILENTSFFMTDEFSPPYIGVFVNTSREEIARQAIAVLLD